MKKRGKILSVILAAAMLVSSVPLSAAADDPVINVPDKNLFKALLSQGADTNGDGHLTKSEMANFTSDNTKIFSLWGSGDGTIKNLEGLQYATQITELEILGCHLDKIQPDVLKGMTSLEELHIENNDITTIPSNAFSGTGIKYFFLSNNKIASLEPNAFSGLNNVWDIDLSKNPLSSIADSSFDNCVMDETVAEINVSHCKLSGVTPFSKLSFINDFDISYNNISDISSLTGTTIQSMKFSHNNITDITPLLKSPRKIYALDVSYNYLDDVSADSPQMHALDTLENEDMYLEAVRFPQKVIFNAKDSSGGGVGDTGIAGSNVTLNLSNYDKLVSATLNGKTVPLSASNTFTGEGRYIITAANHGTNFLYHFTVDKSAPAVKVVKSAKGKVATVTYSDLSPVTVAVTRGGKKFSWPAGGVFRTSGSYAVTVTDRFGRATTVKFSI